METKNYFINLSSKGIIGKYLGVLAIASPNKKYPQVFFAGDKPVNLMDEKEIEQVISHCNEILPVLEDIKREQPKINCSIAEMTFEQKRAYLKLELIHLYYLGTIVI